MRIPILSSIVLGFINCHLSYADTLEFPAGISTSLEIPTNTSIWIVSKSYKGNAFYNMKLNLIIGETSYKIAEGDLEGVYINGPARLTSDAIVSARSTGIPYKLSQWSSSTIQYDISGDGTYAAWIPVDNANADYQHYLAWISAGNTPLLGDTFMGTDADISTSGLLLQYERLPNQTVRSLVIPNNDTTQTITIPAGTKFIFRGAGKNSILFCYLKGIFRNGYLATHSDGFTIEGPDTLQLSWYMPWGGGFPRESKIYNYCLTDESSSPVDGAIVVTDSMVNTIASKITSTTGTYGIATKSELTSSLAQSRTDGINSVLSNPNLWTLYTTSQIQNMAVGDLVLTRQVSGGFVLNYDIEQSADLQNWTRYEALSLPLTGLPTDKAFVRIKAKQ